MLIMLSHMLKSFDFILRMSVFEGLWIGGSCPQILIAVVYNTIHLFLSISAWQRKKFFFLLGAHELNRLTNDLNQSQHILLVSDLKKKKKEMFINNTIIYCMFMVFIGQKLSSGGKSLCRFFWCIYFSQISSAMGCHMSVLLLSACQGRTSWTPWKSKFSFMLKLNNSLILDLFFPPYHLINLAMPVIDCDENVNYQKIFI